MVWNWAIEIPWDIFRWEGNKQWRRRQSSQCDDAKDDARASRRTEVQRLRLDRWRQCARESEKKNRTIFILITSYQLHVQRFPEVDHLQRPIVKAWREVLYKMEYTSRMGIEDPCLEGRWPGSCPASSRRGSGPSSAIDAQVPKSEKEMILSNKAQTKYLEYLGCEVKGKRFGDSFVLVCHVDQVEKRSQWSQFGHKNTSIGESETP